MAKVLYRKLNKKNFKFKILLNLISNFQHFHHAYDFRKKEYNNIQNNIYKLVYFFGYGNCKHISFLIKYILDKSDIKNHIILIKSDHYSHICNLIKFKNKNYIFDGFGRFHFECKINNKEIIPKILHKKKIQSLLLNQYSMGKLMEKKHRNSKKYIAKNSYKLYEKALKSVEEYKPKIVTKKNSFKFPVYKHSKIQKNGFGLYDGKIFNSNPDIKFKNIENTINFPKKHFKEYRYGLIINFKVKFKKKDSLMNIKANDFSLRRYVKGQYYDLSEEKKLQLRFLKKPNFLIKFKNYRNIEKLYITSLLSNLYI